jgi:hypothetical protein
MQNPVGWRFSVENTVQSADKDGRQPPVGAMTSSPLQDKIRAGLLGDPEMTLSYKICMETRRRCKTLNIDNIFCKGDKL